MLRVNSLSGFGRIVPAAGGGGITYVAAGAFQSSVDAVTLPLPASTAENDILVAFLISRSAQAISITGWTETASSPQNNADWLFRLTVLWKRAGAGESDPTTNDSGSANKGAILGFRGCVATGDPWDATSGSVDVGTVSSAVVPGVTTTVANAMVIPVIGFYRAATSSDTMSSGANAALTDFAERLDECTTTDAGSGVAVFTGIKAAAGATGNTTATNASAQGVAYWTGALIPA